MRIYTRCKLMGYFWVTYWANLALTPIYALFVVWSIWGWVQTVRSGERNWRFLVASIGLFFGISSAILLLVFFAHIFVMKSLIAHGSVLWLIYYAGESSAAAGFFLGLAGRGEIRFSAALVSVVMMFQWYGMMIVGLVAEAMLSTAM